MMFHIQKVKSQLQCDNTMFSKTTFLNIIQQCILATEEEIVTTISH